LALLILWKFPPMPKLPDLSQAAVRRREALAQSLAQSAAAKSAKAEKSSAKATAAPKRRAKRG
jgi:hypothetical protein